MADDTEGESVSGQLPAGVMRAGPVSVWSVDALDRFVCWMTYARLFERFDLLGAWVDSAEQFSLVLWDRRAEVGQHHAVADDVLTIILHDTETEHEEPHRTELDRLLLPGQHTPRVGTRLRRPGDDPRPWDNTVVISVSDDLAELTASTPTSGLARVVASGFARLDQGTIWVGMRPADSTPENPWADVHRQLLDG